MHHKKCTQKKLEWSFNEAVEHLDFRYALND